MRPDAVNPEVRAGVVLREAQASDIVCTVRVARRGGPTAYSARQSLRSPPIVMILGRTSPKKIPWTALSIFNRNVGVLVSRTPPQ
jgi:hypothetical protein